MASTVARSLQRPPPGTRSAKSSRCSRSAALLIGWRWSGMAAPACRTWRSPRPLNLPGREICRTDPDRLQLPADCRVLGMLGPPGGIGMNTQSQIYARFVVLCGMALMAGCTANAATEEYAKAYPVNGRVAVHIHVLDARVQVVTTDDPRVEFQ